MSVEMSVVVKNLSLHGYLSIEQATDKYDNPDQPGPWLCGVQRPPFGVVPERCGIPATAVVISPTYEVGICAQHLSEAGQLLIDKAIADAKMTKQPFVVSSLLTSSSMEENEAEASSTAEQPEKQGPYTGMAASPGIARARATVIRSTSSAAAFKGGILIAHMTRPDFIGAMRRASGFVTTRGGRLCHAAIVAREFGVPCVVGVRALEPSMASIMGKVVEVNGTAGTVSVVPQ
jgi:phosphohistidine swiveling domain-containing protein